MAGNPGGDLATANGGALQGAGNLVQDGTGGVTPPATPGATFTGLTGDPKLGPLADNGGPTKTHALLPGSPALNAGRDDLALDPQGMPLTTDQRGSGFPRAIGAHTDVGAFELQTALALSGLVFLDFNANGLVDPGDTPRPDVPVFLDTNGNGRRDPGEPATATGPDGRYTFANLGGGLFTVRLDLPPAHGAVPTAPAGGAYVQVAPVGGYDFGLVLVSPVVPVAAAARFSPAVDSDTAYVQGLYHNLLGRAADAGGLAYWVGRLRAGDSPATVAAGLWQSPEHRTWQVQDYYRTYLHREADAGGLAYHVGLFLSGHAETDVVLDFLTSAEYQAAHAIDEAFVRGLYEDVLGRPADAAGLAHWAGLLASGASRPSVAWQLETSDESYRRMVDGYYAALLHRPADAAGAASWLQKLQQGSAGTTALAPASPAGVAVAFLTGEEYEAAARAGV